LKTLVKIYNDAPPIGKILLILLGCVLLYLIYNAISGLLAKKDSNVNTVNTAQGELNQLAQSGVVTTYTPNQFAAFADTLEQAMSGQGTDEDSVSDVFKYMQNKADVLQLIKSFGVRDYTDDKLFMWNIKPFNLVQWITADMPNPAERDEYINDQLKARSIDYKF
jgi:hypothetical protein